MLSIFLGPYIKKKKGLILLIKMKKKTLTRLPLLLCLVGCSHTSNFVSDSQEKGVTITDLVGRTNQIKEENRKRVLCIGAGALRRYSYIGDRENLVAAEDIDRNIGANVFEDVSRPYYDIHKEYLSTLPSCGKGGPQAQSAEAEKILACNPSLIISEYEDVAKADHLQNQVGVPVVVIKYGPKSVFDRNVSASFTLLGKVLGKEEKAKSLNDYIQSSSKELKSLSSSRKEEEKKSIYIGCLGNWGTQDIYSTSSSFPLFEASGIKNAVSSSIQLTNGKLEKEAFLSLKPDKIVLDSAGLKKFKQTYLDDPEQFDSIDAIQKGEIYLEMPFNAYYTNLEIALMDAYFLASVAYPEQYKSRDRVAKYEEISQAFLGKSCYKDTISKAKRSYGGFQKIDNLKEFLNQI